MRKKAVALNTQTPIVHHRELCSMVCGSLNGRRFGGKWICMAESLCYTPETITASLIGYSPI